MKKKEKNNPALPLLGELEGASSLITMIKRIIFNWRYRRAVRKADKLHEATKRKYLVIVLNGKPVVLSKRRIRNLIATRHFRKGTTVADIENRALHIAH